MGLYIYRRKVGDNSMDKKFTSANGKSVINLFSVGFNDKVWVMTSCKLLMTGCKHQ